jgi:hypothetical protein
MRNLSKDLVLIDALQSPHLLRRRCCVEVILVDWASVFEIEAVSVESVRRGSVFESGSSWLTSMSLPLLLLGAMHNDIASVRSTHS